MSFSINISVKAVDEASATLKSVDSAAKSLLDRARELYAATERGTKLTDSAAKEIRKLASDVRAQENATRLLSRAWLASHDSLLLVMDGFRRAAHVGRALLLIVNSLMLASTAHATATKNLRDAQVDLAKATQDTQYWADQLKKAQQEGDPSKITEAYREYQRALQEVDEANRRLRDAQDEVNRVQSQSQIQLVGLGLTALDLVPSVSALVASLAALKAAGLAAALGTSLLVGAVAALGAGLAYGAVNAFQHKTALNTWGDAVRESIKATEDFPPVLRELAFAFTVTSGGLILIGDRLGVFFGTDLPNMIKSGFEAVKTSFAKLAVTLSGIWSTITSAASSAWSGISSTVISFAQDLWGRLQSGWNTMVSATSQAWENIKSAASQAWGFLRDGWERLKTGLEGLWKGMISKAGEIWEGLVSIVRGILNRVIALANSVISALNSIRITVPEWIPGIGGLSWGVSIPLIPSLQGLREPVEIARETLVKLHPGEVVLPRGWGAAGGVNVYVSVNVRGSVVGVDDIVDAVSRGIASNLRRMIR